jgi:hypothetical protein
MYISVIEYYLNILRVNDEGRLCLSDSALLYKLVKQRLYQKKNSQSERRWYWCKLKYKSKIEFIEKWVNCNYIYIYIYTYIYNLSEQFLYLGITWKIKVMKGGG